jgi:hypothetical protein
MRQRLSSAVATGRMRTRRSTGGKGGNPMKRLLVVLLVTAVAMAAGAPAADARNGAHSRPPSSQHRSHSHSHSHRGHGFGWGFGFGFLSGTFLGAPFYAPSYYAPPLYAPPPAYYGPPPASCYAADGYWTSVPLSTDGGFTTYQQVWVPPQTICR